MELFHCIGVATCLMALVVLLSLAIESLSGVVADIKYKHKQKHRFDKPPLAKCYCVDCIYYDPVTKSCGTHIGWRVYDAWFCWEAMPEKRKKGEQ